MDVAELFSENDDERYGDYMYRHPLLSYNDAKRHLAIRKIIASLAGLVPMIDELTEALQQRGFKTNPQQVERDLRFMGWDERRKR